MKNEGGKVLENLMFSLNAVLPVFLVMLLGYLLRRKKVLTQNFIDVAVTLVFYVSLPAKMFLDVAESDFFAILDGRYVLFLVGATTASFAAAWALGAVLVRRGAKIGAFAHCAFRGNFVYIGLPLVQNILQMDAVPSTVLVITFVVPLYNVLSVLLLSYYDPSGTRPSPRALAWQVLKNPMILAVLAALPFSLLHVGMPYIVDKAVGYVGSLATPLALLFVGASINLHGFGKDKLGILTSALFKTVLQPLVCVAAAVWLGFGAEQIATVFVVMAVPTALNAYIMTKKMGGDGEMCAGIILASMLLSVVTLPAAIWLLRTLAIL